MQKPWKHFTRNPFRVISGAALLAIILVFALSLPEPLFKAPTSTVIEDSTGRLLGARIAKDGQWRFPVNRDIPEKFEMVVLAFEDKRFYYHPGVDPLSVGRALWQNISQGRIVSGASTLTMQVIRLSRKDKPRTVWQKIVESLLAVRAEVRYTKSEILALYTSHAPFGGNVVGMDAAAWRYFGVPPRNLSWGQSAALAVLPNAPSMIHPGKNEEAYKQKRDLLLERLLNREIIDSTTYELACEEPLPGKPYPVPQAAPHLLNHAIADGKKGERIRTTIDYNLQRSANKVTERHHQRLRANKIHNLAAVILEVETGEVLAYVGNTRDEVNRHNNRVDVVTSPRSTGSTLKPFLYAAMLQEGTILPRTLVADVPVNIDGYSPKNFSHSYDGAVHADEVLYRSLNVPMVRMLKKYGLPKFHHLLKEMDFSTITRPSDHYGLSLILGGAETTLWELSGAYASMARILKHYNNSGDNYFEKDFHFPSYTRKGEAQSAKKTDKPVLKAAGIYKAFEALTNLDRPEQESGWKHFSSSRKIAWKTGTSFGFRDAWAVGVTPGYVVGVWAGNADGEGRPGLTGLSAAAPVMMDLFRQLPPTGWFKKPWHELVSAKVCRKSGHLAGAHCQPVDTSLIPENGLRSKACPYHRLIHLDAEGQYRVTDECYDTYRMQHRKQFVLPPVMEWYYRKANPGYEGLPPYAPECSHLAEDKAMEVIYPDNLYGIFIPREIDGTRGKVVFKAAHRNPSATIYWYIDQTYQGQTRHEHQIAARPKPGQHTLTLIDKKGNTTSAFFEVVEE
ncbi:MAG: penicillin-binding protein 1C [Bacteroidales bacterium]|nr:penicillin-binding protein 1C [Bacteroidales bacterium]MCF8333107.1 penicillin-binding protein 1C [Bacteroidales bacterium]